MMKAQTQRYRIRYVTRRNRMAGCIVRGYSAWLARQAFESLFAEANGYMPDVVRIEVVS